MKRLLTWITGMILILLGGVLMHYCIKRIDTDNRIWLGILQGIFGVAVTIDGMKKVDKAIL